MRSVSARGSRTLRLTILLVTVLALPAGALVWLGVRLARQDRELFERQAVERQQSALRAVAQGLALAIARAEQDASDGRASGLVRFTTTGDGLVAQPRDAVLWVPRQVSLSSDAHDGLDEAERLEHAGETTAAADRYAVMASSSAPDVQAGALLGLARLQRQSRAWDSALATYDRLARLTGVDVAGAPVDLQARRARLAVLESAGRTELLRRTALELEAHWMSGRWRLDRPTWELVADDLRRWTGRTAGFEPSRAGFSAAAEYVWTHGGSDWTSHLIDLGDRRVVVWRRAGAGEAALAATDAQIDSWIADSISATGLPLGAVRIDIASADASLPPEARATFSLTPGATGLPWTLTLAPPSVAGTTWRRGQILLFTALGLLIVLVAAGGYSIARLVRRELAVGRLQSDFVAAVSHEFRTPLASIRHLIDLLDESDDMPVDRRLEFYRAVGRNAERLQRLVESLLDFSRMESGRTPYVRVPVDASELARTVVSDFAAELGSRGIPAAVSLDAPAPATIEADAPSLGLALWNLLDNAIKYSPAGSPVRVTVGQRSGVVTIAVRDHGHGVPPGEEREVFGRFARGEAARRMGIHGTGIGLAIVAHVARGHGGDAGVRPVAGGGSEFEIVLPAAPADAPARLPLARDAR